MLGESVALIPIVVLFIGICLFIYHQTTTATGQNYSLKSLVAKDGSVFSPIQCYVFLRYALELYNCFHVICISLLLCLFYFFTGIDIVFVITAGRAYNVLKKGGSLIPSSYFNNVEYVRSSVRQSNNNLQRSNSYAGQINTNSRQDLQWRRGGY